MLILSCPREVINGRIKLSLAFSLINILSYAMHERMEMPVLLPWHSSSRWARGGLGLGRAFHQELTRTDSWPPSWHVRWGFLFVSFPLPLGFGGNLPARVPCPSVAVLERTAFPVAAPLASFLSASECFCTLRKEAGKTPFCPLLLSGFQQRFFYLSL